MSEHSPPPDENPFAPPSSLFSSVHSAPVQPAEMGPVEWRGRFFVVAIIVFMIVTSLFSTALYVSQLGGEKLPTQLVRLALTIGLAI